MNLKESAIKGILWTTIDQFGSRLITFLIGIVLARILFPEEFGLIALLGIFIAIGQVLINGGLTQSLIRSDNLNQADYSTVFFFNLFVSVIIYILLFFLAPYIALFFEEPELISIVRVITLIFVINSFAAIQTARLTKELDFKTQSMVSIPSVILSGVVGIGLAMHDYGVWSLVYSRITLSFATTVQLWIRSKWAPSLIFDYNVFKKHFNFGIKIMLTGLLEAGFTNAYPILIGKFFTVSQVGLYHKSDSLHKQPLTLISSVVSRISFPLLSKVQKDDERLKKVYRMIMQLVIFLVAPTLIFLSVLAEPIFRFLYTEKWVEAVPYFQILCAAGILYPLHVYNLQILNVKGRSDLFFKLEVIKKAIICLVIIVSIQFGIFALLYGIVLTSFIAFFLNSYYSGRYINYNTKSQIRDLIPTIFIALAGGVVVYVIDYMLNEQLDIVRILSSGSIGLFAYIWLSWKLKIEALKESLLIFKSIVKKRT